MTCSMNQPANQPTDTNKQVIAIDLDSVSLCAHQVDKAQHPVNFAETCLMSSVNIWLRIHWLKRYVALVTCNIAEPKPSRATAQTYFHSCAVYGPQETSCS